MERLPVVVAPGHVVWMLRTFEGIKMFTLRPTEHVCCYVFMTRSSSFSTVRKDCDYLQYLYRSLYVMMMREFGFMDEPR